MVWKTFSPLRARWNFWKTFLLVPWVKALYIIIATLGVLDTIKSRLPQSLQNLPEPLNWVWGALPEWSLFVWMTILFGVSLIMVLESTYQQYGKIVRPTNQDALIAAFTDLGAWANDLVTARRTLKDTSRMMGLDTPSKLRKDVEKAEEAYRDAQRAVEREINKAGGMLGRRRTLTKHEIDGKLHEDWYETNEMEPLETRSPSIADSVRQALDSIRKGTHRSGND